MRNRQYLLAATAAVVAALAVAGGCAIVPHHAAGYTTPSPTRAAVPPPPTGSPAPSVPRQGVPAPSGVPVPSPPPLGALRPVHSPGKVVDDTHLKADTCHVRVTAAGHPLPDPACTPGGYDPAVTQDTIATTICTPGWTATQRPPLASTAAAKRASERAYGDPLTFTGEYDHLVPLELGGSNATSNLWPEAGHIPNPKDTVENRLRTAVCTGHLTLDQARLEIAADWTVAR